MGTAPSGRDLFTSPIDPGHDAEVGLSRSSVLGASRRGAGLLVNRLPPRPRRVIRRLVRQVTPPASTWHLTMPGVDRWLELRWAMLVRRAPVMSPEEHAAAVADPRRRHAGIEVPIPCAACRGTR